jgi:hypothetical protein
LLVGRAPYHRFVPIDPPFVFPPVVSGEAIVLSASTFVSFEQCPEQAAGRMRGVYGPESRASFVGGLAHRIFARHLTSGPIDPGDLTAACREEIGGNMNPKMVSLGLKPSQLGEIIEQVSSLYDRFKTLQVDGFAGAEVALSSEPADGVTLRGSIDAVFEDDGGVRLIDWKTGNLGDTEAQLSFYAMLWVIERDDVPARLEAVSVKTGERTEVVPSRSDVDQTARRAAAAIDALRESWRLGSDLERRGGPWCRWCPLLDECSEGRSATDLLSS